MLKIFSMRQIISDSFDLTGYLLVNGLGGPIAFSPSLSSGRKARKAINMLMASHASHHALPGTRLFTKV